MTEDAHYIPQLGPDWRARLERVLAADTDYLLLEARGPRGELWQLLKARGAQPLFCDEQTVLLSAAEVRRRLSRDSPILVVTAH